MAFVAYRPERTDDASQNPIHTSTTPQQARPSFTPRPLQLTWAMPFTGILCRGVGNRQGARVHLQKVCTWHLLLVASLFLVGMPLLLVAMRFVTSSFLLQGICIRYLVFWSVLSCQRHLCLGETSSAYILT